VALILLSTFYHLLLILFPHPQKREQSPLLLAHVYCGHSVAWTRMPLGMEVGLGPGDIAVDGSQPFPKSRAQLPNFRPMSLVAKRLVDQDGTWYGGRPWPRPHSARWGPSSPPPPAKGHRPLPIFGPCLLWSNSRPSQLLLSTCLMLFLLVSIVFCQY